jgi:hypothetical protein
MVDGLAAKARNRLAMVARGLSWLVGGQGRARWNGNPRVVIRLEHERTIC